MDTVSTGSGSDLVSDQHAIFPNDSLIPIDDQVATAPCTDCVQARCPTFEAKPLEHNARLRENGVYLITGGMGGVGLLLAKRLAQTVRARIVLAGRRIRKLQELEDTGAEVLYRSVDVSDETQVRALIDEIYERFGTLDGVFHAAGSTHGKSFSAQLSEL